MKLFFYKPNKLRVRGKKTEKNYYKAKNLLESTINIHVYSIYS
jgi:hypothetical protein